MAPSKKTEQPAAPAAMAPMSAMAFLKVQNREQVEAELERQNLQGTFRLLRAYWNNCGANSYK
jgi:hypothetical protein